MIAQKIMAAGMIFLLSACGGGGDSNEIKEQTETIIPTPTPTPTPTLKSIDRTATGWYISSSVSAIDGKKTTDMFIGGVNGANFHVFCTSDGTKGYYITTEFVTGSGNIRYRVGNGSPVLETWSESSSTGYRRLTPPSFDLTLLEKLYKNWDFSVEISKYGSGTGQAGLSKLSGFPVAIDKTRADCGWSPIMFPPNNGWSTDYPDVPPADAIEATYFPNVTQPFGSIAPQMFSLIAWRATNPIGKKQLLVRLNSNKNICTTNNVMTDYMFAIEQNGKTVSANPGSKFLLSCNNTNPFTLALQGDYEASLPFVLKIYPQPINALQLGNPISSVTFN